jgi:hypothetical protein
MTPLLLIASEMLTLFDRQRLVHQLLVGAGKLEVEHGVCLVRETHSLIRCRPDALYAVSENQR